MAPRHSKGARPEISARHYDLKMPGASGLDVLRETKQADATIPVILFDRVWVGGGSRSGDEGRAYDFLQKPWTWTI